MTTTITKLRTRHARKGETHFTSGPKQRAGRVNREAFQTGNHVASTGTRWVGNQGGIGASSVGNMDEVIKNYKEQVKADRRAAALDRRAGL
jgi:hypothetical protein